MSAVAAERQIPAGATRDDIVLARASRAEADALLAETKETQTRVLNPLWARLTRRAVQNSFGEEYDLSMQPRGSRA